MYARKNRLKEKIANGEIVIGMEIWLRDPRVFELMGHAGFDFAHIENEHVAHNWETVENLVRTAEVTDMTPLYRTEQVFDGRPPVNEIIKALKCGAQIIMVPHVGTPETAKTIVNAVKYPPLGKRGVATCDRSTGEIYPNITTPLDMQKYTQEANEETMVWAIIETPEGVKNIDAILDVEGIYAVGFGHQDYSIAAGLPADSGPEIDEAREKVRRAALKKGKQMWWNTDRFDVVEEQSKKGIQIFLMGVDVIYIDSLFRNIIKKTKYG